MDSSVDCGRGAQLYALERLTNLSIIDEEFVYKVQHDIERFALRRPNQRVLLFPPVNNFRRFLIHQICDNLSEKYDLCTFSVGQGINRRTVVTFQSQLLTTQKFNENSTDCKLKGTSTIRNFKATTMGVKKQSSEVRLNKTNEIHLYRPPALRNNLQTTNNDIENKTSIAAAAAAAAATTIKSGISQNNKLLPTKNVNENGGTKNNSMTLMANTKKCKLTQQQHQLDDSQMATAETTTTRASNSMKETKESDVSMKQQTTVRRERRPDRAVYIPRARRSQTTPPTSTTTTTTTDNNVGEVNLLASARTRNSNSSRSDKTTTDASTIRTKVQTTQRKNHHHHQEQQKLQLREVNEERETLNKIQPIIECDKQQQQQQQAEEIRNESLLNVDENLLEMEKEQQNKAKLLNNSDNNKLKIEENIEEQELKRASKEMNRSNRRIMKQTFVSDVLEIPDQLQNIQSHIKQQQTQTNESTTDEDDWDVMYDESGECLDRKIVQDITEAVGKVKLDLPEMDYSMYLSKQQLLEKECFPHVLEVSNFPAEFKHQDLLMVFSQYKESGFDIKWVDDTHALAVFSSTRIAAEVLTMGHPFVVVKPLSDATPESRAKAKKYATSLQPYRPRPETCAALARRLVTGALGVRLKTAAAEREKEKRVLKEAKERKLMAAKQRDETWDN